MKGSFGTEGSLGMESKPQMPEFCPEALADCWCGRMLSDNTQDKASRIPSEPTRGLPSRVPQGEVYQETE